MPKHYEPAGSELNQLLDTFEGSAQHVHEAFLTALKHQGVRPQCRACCTHCCRQMVLMTLPEGLSIARCLLTMGLSPTKLDRLAKCLMAQGARQAQEGRTAWFNSGEQCAFLVQRHCLIYSVRPVPCRFYYVISDPKLCSSNDEIVSVIDHKPATTILLDHSIEFARVCLGKPQFALATLPTSVLMGLDVFLSSSFDVLANWNPTEVTEKSWLDSKIFT